ncbi:MAG: hypothetical protein JST38_16160 [Bacteroidetes bacterium]|nr:hypothetical protein [Bacteroidota bacterium]
MNSHQHPFQAFQWADYTAKPGYRYTYRVIPMFGDPGALEDGPVTEVPIETEPLYSDGHDVHFNRGAIASQAFVKRFPGLTLDQAGAPAYEWLARDLLPSLLRFIARASGASYSLHAAIYELKWPIVLEAFKAAIDAGAHVDIIYHAKTGDTATANEAVIDEFQVRALVTPRTKAKLMHNKFIVLSKDDVPVAVWTGSTNMSRNALYGQLNVGLSIDDAPLAEAFKRYWTALSDDPDTRTLKERLDELNPQPADDPDQTYVPVFSPRSGRAIFDGWIDMAKNSGKPLFMTFPFGITKDFRPAYDQNDGILRFALLDKYVNGGNADSRAAAIAEIIRIRKHPNVGMALGDRIFVDRVDGWMKESAPIGVNVNWVHTKFMLIDPLGDAPVTFSGSANWSEPSVTDNDENMVLVRGDKRVADIYFGEFMRVFAHHRFRESVARHIEEHGAAAFDTWKPQNLFTDPARWVPDHFHPGSEKDIKRRYFIGA